MDQDNEYRDYPAAYFPIPKVVVKQEPTPEEDDEELNSEKQIVPQPLAYPPLPRGLIKQEVAGEEHNKCSNGGQKLFAYAPIHKRIIKNELQSGEHHDGINLESQQEENQNPLNDNTDVIVNQPTEGAVKNFAVAVGKPNPAPGLADLGGSKSQVMSLSGSSSSIILRTSRSKRSNTKIASYAESSGGVSKDLLLEENIAEIGDELGTDYSNDCGTSEHSSLEGLDSSDDDSSEDIDFGKAAGSSQRQHQSNDSPSSSVKVNEAKKAFPFKCVDCGITYKYMRSLQRHVANMCGKNPSFFCSQCDYQTKWKADLKRHLINIHKADQSQLAESGAGPKDQRPSPFKCEKCGRFFKNMQNHKSHLDYSKCWNDEPSFSCIKCDFRSTWKRNLQKHMIDTHDVKRSQLSAFGAGPKVRPESSFKCDRCDRTYKTKGTLRYHMMKECGVDPSYLCTLCDHRFRKKQNLKYHLINVHGVVDPSQLAAHVVSHSLRCGLCPFRGNKEAGLKKHMAKEHSGN